MELLNGLDSVSAQFLYFRVDLQQEICFRINYKEVLNIDVGLLNDVFLNINNTLLHSSLCYRTGEEAYIYFLEKPGGVYLFCNMM